MFTTDQIESMSKEMIAKSEEHYRDEVLSRMDQNAIKTLEERSFLEIKLRRYITNAFLEGVAQAMSYLSAVLEKEVRDHESDLRGDS